MQLEQFTRIILVGGAGAAFVVIEEIQHCRAARYIAQKIAEIAETMGMHQRVVGGETHGDARVAIGIHVEVIMPEFNHHLAQLPRAVDGAQPRCRAHVICWQVALLPCHFDAIVRQMPERFGGLRETAKGAIFR